MEVFVVHHTHVTVVAQDSPELNVKQVYQFNSFVSQWEVIRVTSILCSLAVCIPDCLNGGFCSSPKMCNCSGTGYNGSQCQTRMCSWVLVYNALIIKDVTQHKPNTYVAYHAVQLYYIHVYIRIELGFSCPPNTCDCCGTRYTGSQCQTGVQFWTYFVWKILHIWFKTIMCNSLHIYV